MGGAYGIFLAEKRPEYTKACAGKKASAISTMAGDAWNQLSEQEKKPYQEKYEQAKAQYDKDMIDFLAAGETKTKGVMALRRETSELPLRRLRPVEIPGESKFAEYFFGDRI